MNVKFGLFPPFSARQPNGRDLHGKERKPAYTRRALADLRVWLGAS